LFLHFTSSCIGLRIGFNLLKQYLRKIENETIRMDTCKMSIQIEKNRGKHMKITASAIFLFLLASFAACQQKDTKSVEPEKVELETKLDTLSYAVGQELGVNLKNQNVKVDIDLMLYALKNAYIDTNYALTPEQAREAIVDFQTEQYEKEQEGKRILGDENREKGEKFLAENAKKEGVISTGSGLQYKILKPGKGRTPEKTSVVSVFYRSKNIDGVEYENNYDEEKPVRFYLHRVIAGWTEGIQLMKEGAKYEFYVPDTLAYGFGGKGDKVGPNETLIFEIELVKVEDKMAADPKDRKLQPAAEGKKPSEKKGGNKKD
jgi:FKBP-type peptidyl-prolyl cis-trans isomerase